MFPVLFHFPEWLPLLGGVPLTSFGVMMFASFLVGGVILRRELERMEAGGEEAWDLIFYAVVGGIAGAKLYYVLLNYPRLVADPFGMIFSRAGMVWYGGFLLATAAVVWKTKKLGLSLGRVADATAVALPVAYAVGRLGCFLVGDDYGRATDSWVGIAFPNGSPPTSVEALESQFGVTVPPELVEKYGNIVPVHPTQLYEIGLSMLIFGALWRIRRHGYAPGWLFSIWMILAGAERFAVEFFRAKDDRFFGAITLAQLISLALALAGALLLLRLWKPASPKARAPASRSRARRRARARGKKERRGASGP